MSNPSRRKVATATATAVIAITVTLTAAATQLASQTTTPPLEATATPLPTKVPPSQPTSVTTAQPTRMPIPERRHYVSKLGSNLDGESWTSAWNELDQINWQMVQPGDAILIDGGDTEMIYESTLNVQASGSADLPIILMRSDEAGHNGTVSIFGGRTQPLPYCNQSSYVAPTNTIRRAAIILNGRSWIVIDGGRRSGIRMYGHNGNGIALNNSPSHITVRNVEIYNNGTVNYYTGPTNNDFTHNTWYADEAGVKLSGSELMFDRVIVHDNGQDSFQDQDKGVNGLTIRASWLYDSQAHPERAGYSFNYCTHNDGLQIWGGGTQANFTIEDSVIGPYTQQGIMLGDTNATVNQVTIKNSLFINATDNNLIHDTRHAPAGWTISNVTSYMTTKPINAQVGHCGLSLAGSGHSITRSIFSGGCLDLPNWSGLASDNIMFETDENIAGFAMTDPQFSGPLPSSNQPTFQELVNADFTPHCAACVDASGQSQVGSNIHSVAALLAHMDALNGGAVAAR